MLITKKLSYSYPEVFELAEVNLELQSGKILGIIGHSGSGKSTLLHLLAGLKEPNSGEIFINGEKLRTPSRKLVPGHEKIKLVTQQNTLFPNISIFENIAYELRYYTKEYQLERVNYLSDILNLKHLLKKVPRELSGGEIQRVMIAKAMADEPYVLLLDEPMANLDRIHKKQVMLSLQDLVEQENVACAMVTHDIFDAFGMAHELLIMDKGTFVQKGSSQEIYFQPENLYVAELTGQVNTLTIQLEKKYFRAENVKFVESSENKGTVINSIFQGSHYDIILKVNEEFITVRSEGSLDVGSELYFTIKSFIHFD